jgi:hypothetical protein
MMKRKPITAGELMSRLANDPDYISRMAVKEQQRAESRAAYASEESKLVEEVRSLGYNISSVWDFVNNKPHPVLARRFVGPYTRAYPVLVKHLSLPHHPKIREGIVRALTEKTAAPFASEALLKEFYSEKDIEVRWAIANALKTIMPLKERKNHPKIAEVYKNKEAP